MMLDVKDIYKDVTKYMDKEVTLEGWIRNHRKQKEFGFIAFNDGTYFNNVQLVYDNNLALFDNIQRIRIGSAIRVSGTLIKSPKEEQDFEVQVKSIELLGESPEDYPMQPKQHSREFFREQAYLRPRTNLFSAVFRVRSIAAMAIHNYFQTNGFVYFHSPFITATDCEGSGEMFKLTTFDLNKLPLTKDGKVDYKEDLFGKEVYLTGSGQLHAEAFAMAFKKVYTFGPTFRKERSNTKTHANEFWMIEPEIAFADLNADMEIMESMLKYVIKYVLDNAPEEIKFFDKFVEEGLFDKLTKLVNSPFARITHSDAIKILKEANVKWEFTPEYGEDIAKEHERYLTDEYFKGPVFVTDWPKDIKAFYMKLNADGKTVAAVDLEVPGAGELMGGSQREEDLDKLVSRMKDMNIAEEGLDWYLNLRKYGGCVHSGFGMGFERLLIYLTGVENIRDVIPFPRTPGNCDF